MTFLICILLMSATLSNCGKKKSESDVVSPTYAQDLLVKYNSKLLAAKEKAQANHGWLETSECDGILWAGKYACGGGSPDIAAAEYPDDLGKFNRRPAPYCGAEFGNSKTTWSRDMGMGLISYAWCKKDLGVLERHASYGTKKNWTMGEPIADGRTVYTPTIIGILYQGIYKLGGTDSPARVWPSIYSSGLDDYQAHLQMVDIWLRGEIDGKRDLGLEISQTMYERVVEHSDREPTCAFYQYMMGIYSGSLDKVTTLLLESDDPRCTYARGGVGALESEWLFVSKLTLKKFGLVE